MTAPDTPDETPRATLAEDERVVAEVLTAHRLLKVTLTTVYCSCRFRAQDIEGYAAHVAEHLAPLLAAARAAGVAQGRAEAAAAIRAEINDEGMRNASHFDYGLDEAARIAEGAEQREDA